MPSFFDKRKEGIGIQKEYADKRRRFLNKRDEEKVKLVRKVIENLAAKSNVPLVARGDKEGWEVIYHKLVAKLKTCDLTINLEADSWFGGDEENKYKTYATTYQKNIDKSTGKAVLKDQRLKDGKLSEDAISRMHADDRTTLPTDWKDASLWHFQRRRLYKAMSTTKGKTFDQTPEMKLGETLTGDVTGVEIANPNFNRYAKQVFAALNYGNRPHGASVKYGYSFIVLRPELKRKAIYFPSDTFTIVAANATSQQATFETLGAILAYCSSDMAENIWEACYDAQKCADTEDPYMLLEAHIFDEVRINRDIESLRLSRRLKNDQKLDGSQWEKVKRNAHAWGERNNVRVYPMSG